MSLRVMWIAAAVACGGSSPPPAPPAPPAAVAVADAGGNAAPLDEDLARLAQRSLAMYHDVAQALAESQDCAAAAARLHMLAERYRDVVTANARVLHDGRARELRAALDPHSDDFDRSAQAIVTSPMMSRCSQDPAFAKAFDDVLEPPP